MMVMAQLRLYRGDIKGLPHLCLNLCYTFAVKKY